jgi:hypothetical protein
VSVGGTQPSRRPRVRPSLSWACDTPPVASWLNIDPGTSVDPVPSWGVRRGHRAGQASDPETERLPVLAPHRPSA